LSFGTFFWTRRTDFGLAAGLRPAARLGQQPNQIVIKVSQHEDKAGGGNWDR
jgi:hypothetical protein